MFVWPAAASGSDAPGRITGIGGIFVVSKNPKALATWYHDVLGISLESWGGAIFHYEGESYLAPSQRDFMLDFAVDDLDAFVTRLQAKGVTILKRDDSDPTGKFAWILDPDGTKIELRQPTKP
jgi:catechol 2,3-dioxygenase-like lactoylglutathione lyase family enzyme